MVNQQLIGFYAKNEAIFIPNSRKKEEKITVWDWEKEK